MSIEEEIDKKEVKEKLETIEQKVKIEQFISYENWKN